MLWCQQWQVDNCTGASGSPGGGFEKLGRDPWEKQVSSDPKSHCPS